MEFKFCPFCGDPLQKKLNHGRKISYCESCRHFHYRNPTAGAAVILVENKKLLLVKRLGSYKGMWCIPCGHVEWDEDIRMCAKREIKEETGLTVAIGPVFDVHSNFHDMDKQTVGIWFLGKCIGGTLKAGSDAAEVGYFSLDALPGPMAFPTDIIVCDKLRHFLQNDDLPNFLD